MVSFLLRDIFASPRETAARRGLPEPFSPLRYREVGQATAGNSSHSCYFFLTALLILAAVTGIAAAQTSPPTSEEIHPDDERVTLVPYENQFVWEFGVEIAAQGTAQQILTYFPVPIDWPEQTVRIVEQRRVGDAEAEFEDLDKLARIMRIGIPTLPRGSEARVAVICQVEKSIIVAPRAPHQLTIPKSIPKPLKPFIQESPFIEIQHPKVKKFAAEIELDDQATAWQRVEKIYDVVRERIPYRFDPEIRSLPTALAVGHGDCEELTSLFIAVCRIHKIPARAVWIPGHTYAEFYLEDSSGEGHWYPCQLAGTRLFGEMVEERPILQKGDRFLIPPYKKPTRYVAPQLISDGAVELNWIATRIDPETGKRIEGGSDQASRE